VAGGTMTGGECREEHFCQDLHPDPFSTIEKFLKNTTNRPPASSKISSDITSPDPTNKYCSAKITMSSFWIRFVLGTTVLLSCFWIVTCGPIPVKKVYLHTHVEVQEVRADDSTVGIKTSLGYFVSDINQVNFNHRLHSPYWGDTSTSTYTFRHVDKHRYESLDHAVKYLHKESNSLAFDVSHIDSRVRKPEGSNVKKFPVSADEAELWLLPSAHFYQKNGGICYLYYNPSNPHYYSILVLPDSERIYTKWEVKYSILEYALRNVH
jgi:hypothetical protein